MSLLIPPGSIRHVYSFLESASSRLGPPQRCGINRRHILGAFAVAPFVPFIRPDSAWADQAHGEPPTIVIDPGHGGHDPGAIGVTGLYEKHVALTVARDLKGAFEKSGRYRVMLTRDDDVYLPLEERTHYAQKHNAKVFVSLHADALTDHEVRGASVYTLSFHASDAQTSELARSENSVDPAAAKDDSGYSPSIADILENLDEHETRIFSVLLQRGLVQSLSERILMLHRPSRHANFVVLRSADVPSVLVEMGFMSNKADELLLQSAEHRRRIVASLQHGIEACMNSFTLLTPVG